MNAVKRLAQKMLHNSETREYARALLSAIEAVEAGRATTAQHGLVLRATQAQSDLRLSNSQNAQS